MLFADLASLEFIGGERFQRIPIVLLGLEFLPRIESCGLTMERESVAEEAGFDFKLSQIGIAFRPSDRSRHASSSLVAPPVSMAILFFLAALFLETQVTLKVSLF